MEATESQLDDGHVSLAAAPVNGAAVSLADEAWPLLRTSAELRDVSWALARRDGRSAPLPVATSAAALSPLRYPGSKRQLSSVVGSLIAANFHEPPLLLVEPFCGGASMSLKLLVDGLIEKALLNDADPLIWAFWYTAAFDTAWLVDAMYAEPVTVARWEYHRDSDPRDRRDLAIKCLFLNRTTFSGILHRNAGPIGGKRQASAYKIDCRFNKPELAKRLALVGYLANVGRIVDVSRLDYQAMLVQLQADLARLAVPNDAVLVYLDPPYVAKAAHLYEWSFEGEQHDRLRSVLAELPWHWVLSYDDHEEVHARYEPKPSGERRVTTVKVPGRYSTAGSGVRGARDELLVTTLTLPSDFQEEAE